MTSMPVLEPSASVRSTLPGGPPPKRSRLMERVWSNPDGVAIVFVGTSAEFALHPMADWLFYTGRLPADPVARFAGTLRYVSRLLFAPSSEVWGEGVADIGRIHRGVEESRGMEISNRDYRDTLLMLLYYSLRADELVFDRRRSSRTEEEQLEAVVACGGMAAGMGIVGFPESLAELRRQRADLVGRLGVNRWTGPLLESYRRALGPVGYFLLEAVYGGLLEDELAGHLGVRRGLLSRVFSRYCSLLVRSGLQRVLLTPRVRAIRRVAQASVGPIHV